LAPTDPDYLVGAKQRLNRTDTRPICSSTPLDHRRRGCFGYSRP
jgi:hypothetical protein